MESWLALAADEVHLWQAPLDLAPGVLEPLAASLSSEERERATRFRFDIDRTHFIAARGWMRSLLARYIGCSASEVVLTLGPHGKPQLEVGPAWLRFNLSHSNGLAIYAVARDREVGVDVEYINRDVPIEDMARQFSPREREELFAQPESDRLRAAFDCWTRKEAFLKALGTGMTLPPDEFDVSSLGPDVSTEIRHKNGHDDGLVRWSVYSFDSTPGYSAAVAVEGSRCSVPAAAQTLVLADARARER